MDVGKEKNRKNSEERMVLAASHSCLSIFISVVRIISELHVNSRFYYTCHSTAQGTEGPVLFKLP
jgi:hypothetical protein